MLFRASETVKCKIEVYDSSNDLVTPDTITITITNPSGTVKVNGATPTASSTGKYYYNYDVPASPTEGRWVIEWQVTDDSATTIVRDYFEVEA